ncbi:hypothetical protein ACFOWX_08640 [Sphingorhabdus arenilitoris]|uniref:Methyltransferase n=1 Tax=Sphingorhabdus arenilitoris TaxID=1490041 RepID=A0ABV8RGT9_9SPHN
MDDNKLRGAERETSLGKDGYFSDHYFSVLMMATFGHQINDIYNLKPRNIVEIGIGNGLIT